MRVIWTVVAGVVIIFIALALFSCNRKMNFQQTKVTVDSSYKHKYDSTIEVNKTLSEAYESLLQSTSNSDVVFETTPCPDSGKIGGAGLPHIINRVIIDKEGNKTYEGQIKSFRESASVMERKYYSLTQSYDSLNAKKIELENNYSKLQEQKNKVVTVKVFPWYWAVFCFLFVFLWLNERFSLIKIPFLTKK
jgi:hypothetical protein